MDLGAFEYGTTASVTITTTSLSGGETYNPYYDYVYAYGGVKPYTWSIYSGSLPSGLSLDADTGEITGTPAATGGVTPYSWSIVSGSLPTGLSLNSSTGTISGTPRKTGAYNFTIRVTDSDSPADTDDQALSITVNN